MNSISPSDSVLITGLALPFFPFKITLLFISFFKKSKDEVDKYLLLLLFIPKV